MNQAHKALKTALVVALLVAGSYCIASAPVLQADTLTLTVDQLSEHTSGDHNIHPFYITLQQKFTSNPSIVTSLIGLQGWTQNSDLRINTKTTKLRTTTFIFTLTIRGRVEEVQMRYLVYDRTQFFTMGLYFWQGQESTPNLMNAQDVSGKVTFKQQFYFTNKTSPISTRIKTRTIQPPFESNLLSVSMQPYLKNIYISGDGSVLRVINYYQGEQSELQIYIESPLEIESAQNVYGLIVQLEHFQSFGKQQSYLLLNIFSQQIHRQSHHHQEYDSILLMIGLNTLQPKCHLPSDLSLSNLENNLHELNYNSTLCSSQTIISTLWLITPNGTQEDYYSQRLLDGCAVGQVDTDWNWIKLLLVTDRGQIKKTQSSKSCQPCPLGCLDCNYVSCQQSYCWNANCSDCKTGFTVKYRQNNRCANPRWHCGCSDSNTFLNSNTETCLPCSTVIPNCGSCSQHEWAGTFCTSCNTGFFGQGGGNMPRVCASCPPGCNACSSSTVCSTCANNLIKVSGACACDSGLFYGSAGNNCVICSVAIPSCISCTASGLTTTCNTCTTGTFLNSTSGLCQTCNTYCSSCTATVCNLCVSNTFTIVGASCSCNSAQQKFLTTSTNPDSCLTCSSFIANCDICNNTLGTLLCQTCLQGFFLDASATTCTACILQCLNCTSLLDCFNCTTTFVTNGTSCVCDTGYILNAAGTQCLLCQLLVPNCQTCIDNSGVLFCQLCNDPFYNATTNASSCTLCPVECTSCLDSTTCLNCITGYSLNNNTNNTCTCDNCAVCQLIWSNCSVCDNITCLNCQPGFFLNFSSVCQICPTGCSTCVSSTFCNACLSPFIQVGNTCQCNTANAQYYDSAMSTCSACSVIFVNCTTCTGSGYTSQCTACTTGTYLSNSTCLVCPSNSTACSSANTSTNCLPTFSLVSGQCICDPLYQQFINILTNNCDSCTNLISNCVSCVTNNSTAVMVECTDCSSGLYIDANLTCTVCPSTCLTCSSPTQCGDCVISYTNINGTCQCNINTQVFEAGGFCAPCQYFINHCLSCEGTGPSTVTCSSCVTGTYLNTPLNDTCIFCSSNCDTCDSQGCLNCSSGFSVVNSECFYLDLCGSFAGMDANCIDCVTVITYDNATQQNITTENCLACQAGYYLFGNSQCISCPSTCISCLDLFTCLTCQPTFTLYSGKCQCDTFKNQVQSINGACFACSALLVGCQTCNPVNPPLQCSACTETYVLFGFTCMSCPLGCLSCQVNSTCLSCIPGYTFDSTFFTCNNSQNCTSTQFYDPNNSSCISCPLDCATCSSSTVCLSCESTYSLINQLCICDAASGLFYSPQTLQCSQCGSYNSTSLGVHTTNCDTCFVGNSSISISVGFECLTCATGFYVNGTCQPCQIGCSRCTSTTSCYFCQAPAYVYSAGMCVCDNFNNYFANGSICQLCTIGNCTICSSLIQCLRCSTGFFLNSSNQCQEQICGDGLTHGSQGCDDGNTVNGDGCDSICQVQLFYICINPSVGVNSSCYLDTSRFKIALQSTIYTCNNIDFNFRITGTSSVDNCDFIGFIASHNVAAIEKGFNFKGGILTYSFTLNQTIQSNYITFHFDPTTLCIPESYNLGSVVISSTVDPTNNKVAVYYGGSNCTDQTKVQNLVSIIEYSSYAVLALSALPCKIVGLELFGVLQLAFLSMGNLDNVNLMMNPLKKMKGVNGFNLDIGKDQTSRLLQIYTPERIDSIDYRANFIRNCNIMLMLVIAIMITAFVLYVIARMCKNCAPCLYRFAQRIIKEVLLTFILFNGLNFAYAAGVHFNYAPTSDSLYVFGTLGAVAILVVPVLMAIGLMCGEEEGFGEFKNKLKNGWLQKSYFVITIIYRMSIGLYLSTNNQNQLSSLLILAISLSFLIYNLVNLPFTKAYHNYRANVCHISQFIILFVVMYYRSMISTRSYEETSYIYTPAYILYSCLVIALFVSLIVLIYEIYLFVKECCTDKRVQNLKESSNGDGEVDRVRVMQVSKQNMNNTEQNVFMDEQNIYDEFK